MTSGNSDNQSEQLQIILLDNALDSLLSAAEAVRRDEGPRSLKEAVLHLGNGTELLVKARLAREHWSLIFSNLDQASYEKLNDAEFSSVDFPKAITRLEQIVRVSVDEVVVSHINNLRKLRNQLTHFTATLDSAQTKSLVAKAMAFCVEFCEQQGMVGLDNTNKLGEVHINLAELQEFVNDRMKNISEEWKYASIWECLECWQQALVVDGGEASCKYCKREFDPRELASNYLGRVEDCPECGELSTFAMVGHTTDGAEFWSCFSCGQGGQNYDNCMRCDQMDYFADNVDVKICESCWTDIIAER